MANNSRSNSLVFFYKLDLGMGKCYCDMSLLEATTLGKYECIGAVSEHLRNLIVLEPHVADLKSHSIEAFNHSHYTWPMDSMLLPAGNCTKVAQTQNAWTLLVTIKTHLYTFIGFRHGSMMLKGQKQHPRFQIHPWTLSLQMFSLFSVNN